MNVIKIEADWQPEWNANHKRGHLNIAPYICCRGQLAKYANKMTLINFSGCVCGCENLFY